MPTQPPSCRLGSKWLTLLQDHDAVAASDVDILPSTTQGSGASTAAYLALDSEAAQDPEVLLCATSAGSHVNHFPCNMQESDANAESYMALDSETAEESEQLMLFQLPPLVPAHNRQRKAPPSGALQLKDAEEDEPPPKSLPFELAPGGKVCKCFCRIELVHFRGSGLNPNSLLRWACLVCSGAGSVALEPRLLVRQHARSSRPECGAFGT